jgi:predicted phage-related endonuclease
MVANIDRWLVEPGADGPAAILEVKTAGHHMADRWEQGPPDRVLVQVQHQLAVCGLGRAFVAVLIGGRDFRTFEVARDDELIDMLIGVEREFWQRVEHREPPAPDASESASEALRHLYAEMQRDVEVELPAEARPLIEAYRTTKRQLDELDEDKRRQANAIKALIGEAHVGLLDGEKAVTWSRWVQQRLDRDRLEADHPHLVAEYLVDEQRDRLTLAKKG